MRYCFKCEHVLTFPEFLCSTFHYNGKWKITIKEFIYRIDLYKLLKKIWRCDAISLLCCDCFWMSENYDYLFGGE